MRVWLAPLMASVLVGGGSSRVVALPADPVLRIVSGVTEVGDATDFWLAMIHKRLPRERYDAVAPLRKPLTAEERAWADLIRSRVTGWEGEVPALAEVYRPIVPPRNVLIVIGNRGAEDAFTHDPTTIGFDLAALQANYGDARLPENADRMDRFFRHEFVHLLQKAWMLVHPWEASSPLRAALVEIWGEGLGNYQSLSARWRSEKGRRSETAARALAELEPRFVARLSALACAAPEAAAVLVADLSSGRFDRKWGALTMALWLEADQEASAETLRNFVLAGPEGVWNLADRHLPEALRPVLKEARLADSLCAARHLGAVSSVPRPPRRSRREGHRRLPGVLCAPARAQAGEVGRIGRGAGAGTRAAWGPVTECLDTGGFHFPAAPRWGHHTAGVNRGGTPRPPE